MIAFPIVLLLLIIITLVFQVAADGQVVRRPPAGEDLAGLANALHDSFGLGQGQIREVAKGAVRRLVVVAQEVR